MQSTGVNVKILKKRQKDVQSMVRKVLQQMGVLIMYQVNSGMVQIYPSIFIPLMLAADEMKLTVRKANIFSHAENGRIF